MRKSLARGWGIASVVVVLAACSSGASEARSTENAPPPASTSGNEPAPQPSTAQGHCVEIDPWSQSGAQREVPCEPATSQPVLDPYHSDAPASS